MCPNLLSSVLNFNGERYASEDGSAFTALYRSSFELVLHCHSLSFLLNNKMDENVWENILLKKICSQESFMSYVLLEYIKML